MEKHPVIIIGAGPAGIGVAALLAQANIPAIILERGRIGESFHLWSQETRFISPSFTGNFFGAVDLNAITPDSSPAFSFRQEHISGKQYAGYLKNITEFYQLKIRNGIDVTDIKITQSGDIKLTAGKKHMSCQHLIWAGGEFQYPKHIPHTIWSETEIVDKNITTKP